VPEIKNCCGIGFMGSLRTLFRINGYGFVCSSATMQSNILSGIYPVRTRSKRDRHSHFASEVKIMQVSLP